MRRRAWLVYLLGGSAAIAAYFVAPILKGNGLWFNVIGLSAAVAIVAGVKMYRPKPAAAWWLFALAQVSFVIGDAVYYNWKPLFPSIGDIFYLAFYPIQVVGLLMLIRRRSGGKDFRSFLDAAILTAGLGVLSWAFLIQPYFRDPGLTAVERLVSLGYPLMDLALLAVTARMAVGAWPRHPAFYLLGAGLMSMLITDALYGFIELQGGYNPGSPLDSGWLIYYLLWGAAALHPSMTKLSEPAGVGPPLTWRRLALLSAATLIAPVADAIESGPDQVAYSIFSAVLFLLVAARMTGLITSMETIQLRRSEERFTALVRHSSDVITVVGPDLVVRYQTPSSHKVLGYPPEDLVGSDLTQLVHPDDRGAFQKFFRSPAAVDDPHSTNRLEWRLMHKEGHWVPVEAIVNNLLDDPGVRGLVLTMRDVTERKALEEGLRRQVEDLKELDRIKSDFVSTVSHELRTPLTSISGYLELLEDQDSGNLNDEQRDTIAVIDRNTSRLLNLIENLLTLSGIEQQAFSLNKTPTDLAKLMQGVKDTVFLMASGRSLEVEFSIDDDIGLALVDGQQLDRALLNLVTNAIKFTPAGGQIVVSARRDGDDINFRVADTGLGIPAEDQDKLFSRFFRSSVSNDLAIQGTGLGLVIVKTIVEAHGGTIQLDSRPGAGTTVTFSIPAALPQKVAGSQPAEALEPGPVAKTAAADTGAGDGPAPSSSAA